MTADVAVVRAQKRRDLDKWAFFVVFGLGVLTILVAEALALPKLEAVLVCSGLLVVYAVALLTLPALRLRTDQVGDNCYYLGLLFTLTSLGLALYRFASSDLGTDSILRNFGIAIGTTIAGLGLRVGITQFREDPEDLEYEAREALATTVRKLRADLDQSVAELQRFADGARQALMETSEAARNSTAQVLATSTTRFEAALEETARAFNENTVGFNKRATTVNKSLDKVADAVEALTTRIASVKPNEELIEAGMKPALDALQGAVSSFASALETQRTRIDEGFRSLGQFSNSAEQFQASADALSRAAAGFEQGVSHLNAGADLIERLDTTTRSAADAAQSLAKKMAAAATATGDKAAEAMERLESVAAGLSDRTSASIASIEQVTAQAVETLGRLNQEFSGSSQSIEHVRRELAELAGWIIERLNKP